LATTLTYLTSCATNGLAERYAEALSNIASAERDAGVEPGSTKLIVVSKTHPADLVLELMQLGAVDFGENRDQEAAPKSLEVSTAVESARAAGTWSGQNANWHFIGQLQSNKVKSVLRYANSIHSLDRESLLQALVKELAKPLDPDGNLANSARAAGLALPVFIELNLTGQPERGGIMPENLLEFAEQVLAHDSLKLQGVMGVAGLDVEPAADFDRIRAASESLQTLAPAARFMSAGMSGDYQTAIRHGATHVRIGTSITGKRDYSV
jgi:pyridoxal phosphate enzyme (YggS family)